MGCQKPKELPTFSLPLDTRSPSGSAGRKTWALVLNAQTDISGRMMRLAGWRRFGWEAIAQDLFVNQDFHDQLQQTDAVVESCDAATSVVIAKTTSSADGSVGLGIQHDGATPSRVRWYRDDVLVYDSAA